MSKGLIYKYLLYQVFAYNRQGLYVHDDSTANHAARRASTAEIKAHKAGKIKYFI